MLSGFRIGNQKNMIKKNNQVINFDNRIIVEEENTIYEIDSECYIKKYGKKVDNDINKR